MSSLMIKTTKGERFEKLSQQTRVKVIAKSFLNKKQYFHLEAKSVLNNISQSGLQTFCALTETATNTKLTYAR